MQIVIDISEEVRDYIIEHELQGIMAEAIANGTPLPKGHGRLIDADALLSKAKFLYKGYEVALTNTIGDAPTIIEADKE